MFTISWIISVSLLVVSFLGIIFTSLFLAKPVDEHKVSFMRMFPFEMMKTAENNGKFYNFSTYLFSGLCFTPIIVIVEEATRLQNLNPLSIFIACLLGLAALCFVFLNIFDVTHVKPHLSLFGVFALLTFLSGSLVTMRGIIAFGIFSLGIIELDLVPCRVLITFDQPGKDPLSGIAAEQLLVFTLDLRSAPIRFQLVFPSFGFPSGLVFTKTVDRFPNL